MARRFLIAVAVMALGAVFVAPAAQAAFGIEKWESITCKENLDTPGVGEKLVGTPFPAQSAGQCKGATTPEKLFTQSSGHPNFGITDFTLNTFPEGSGAGGFPQGFVSKIVVDTPEGLSVNPEAVPQCPIAEINTPPFTCKPETIVGVNYLTVAGQAPACTAPFPGNCIQARAAVPVYNVEPFLGVPSMVGFPTEEGPTFIVGSLSPIDQHVTFTISDIHKPGAEHPKAPPIVGSRLVFFGNKGLGGKGGAYLTMPSNCAGPQESTLTVTSYASETEPSITDSKTYPTPTGATGCEDVPFKPTIAVSADGPKATDSPEATTVDVGIPFDAKEPIANSYLKTAKVTLPEGMGINPSSANGLVPCKDAQFAKGTNDPIACPDESKIGTVEVQTPSLPPNSLGGTVYVGEPLKNGPGASSSGEQFRIFIHATSVRYGVNVRLIGNVFPNQITGQLTAVVPDNPQATFSNFRLHLNGGAKGTLTSPPICGPNLTTTEMTPWSGNPDQLSGRRQLSENAGRAAVRPRVYGEVRQHQGGRLQSVQGAHRAS
jgi:hypothetical protein